MSLGRSLCSMEPEKLGQRAAHTIFERRNPGKTIGTGSHTSIALSNLKKSDLKHWDEWYCATVRRRGGDPDIGPKLPLLLKDRGFINVAACAVQRMSLIAEMKLISPLTSENVADAAVAEGLTTTEEVSQIVDSLYEYAQNPDTFSGLPRVVQAWGRRPL